ncbi:MAG: restriction endonuclease [Myxococcota bacterium]
MSLTWQEYELSVLEHLRQEYAGLPVRVVGTEGGRRHEVVGRHSIVPRQLDVAAYAEGDERPVFVADAKHYGEKIDVKDVESFAGMADDVGARFSALIAPAGFTDAAFRRAAAVQTGGPVMWSSRPPADRSI